MIKGNIRKKKLSTFQQSSKNSSNVENQPNVGLKAKKNFHHISSSSVQSSLTQTPLQPTLNFSKSTKNNKLEAQPQQNQPNITHGQTELHNHKIRKQMQRKHNNTIHQFNRRKRQIARIMNSEDKMKRKKNEIQNRIQQYSKNIMARQGQPFQSRDQINSSYGCQIYNCSQFKLSQKITKRKKVFVELTHPYISSAFNIKNVKTISENQAQNPFVKMKNILSRREVYLSNIANLQELRYSLSHSRANFHRKAIKMEREIGKCYIPFEDRLIGDENGVKGIFM